MSVAMQRRLVNSKFRRKKYIVYLVDFNELIPQFGFSDLKTVGGTLASMKMSKNAVFFLFFRQNFKFTKLILISHFKADFKPFS